jgi:hypothetical protein
MTMKMVKTRMIMTRKMMKIILGIVKKESMMTTRKTTKTTTMRKSPIEIN